MPLASLATWLSSLMASPQHGQHLMLLDYNCCIAVSASAVLLAESSMLFLFRLLLQLMRSAFHEAPCEDPVLAFS
jgi:hypothetical protein